MSDGLEVEFLGSSSSSSSSSSSAAAAASSGASGAAGGAKRRSSGAGAHGAAKAARTGATLDSGEAAVVQTIQDGLAARAAGGGRGMWQHAPEFIARNVEEGNFFCSICADRFMNDGSDKQGSTNALVHAATLHSARCPQPWLAQYVESVGRKIPAAVAAIKERVSEAVKGKVFASLTQDFAPRMGGNGVHLAWTTRSQQVNGLGRLIAEAAAASNLPFNICASDYTGRLVQALAPGLAQPSRPVVTQHTDEVFVDTVVEELAKIKLLENFAGSRVLAEGCLTITADMWTATEVVGSPGALLVTGSALDEFSFRPTRFVLATRFVEGSHTGKHIWETLDTVLSEPFADFAALNGIMKRLDREELQFKLAKHVRGALVHDRGANMQLAGELYRDDIHKYLKVDAPEHRLVASHLIFELPCSNHLVETAAGKASGDAPAPILAFKDDLSWTKGLFVNATLRQLALKRACDKAGVDFRAIPSSTKTRWYSQATQIDAIVGMWPGMGELESKDMGFTGNAAERSGKEAEFNRVWKDIEKAVSKSGLAKGYLGVLAPVRDFIIYHSGEKYVSISKLPGSLDKVEDALNKIILDPIQSDEVKAFAGTMKREIKEHFKDHVKKEWAYAAQILDVETTLQIDPLRAVKERLIAETNPEHVNNKVVLSTLHGRFKEGFTALSSIATRLNAGYSAEVAATAKAEAEAEAAAAAVSSRAAAGTLSTSELLAGPAASSSSVIAARGREQAAALAAGATGGAKGTEFADWATFFEKVVLPELKAHANKNASFADFWSSMRTAHASTPGLHQKWWLITLSIVRRVCATPSTSTPSERLGSTMTRLLSEERTRLTLRRAERLALMREVLRGRWARQPLFRHTAEAVRRSTAARAAARLARQHAKLQQPPVPAHAPAPQLVLQPAQQAAPPAPVLNPFARAAAGASQITVDFEEMVYPLGLEEELGGDMEGFMLEFGHVLDGHDADERIAEPARAGAGAGAGAGVGAGAGDTVDSAAAASV